MERSLAERRTLGLEWETAVMASKNKQFIVLEGLESRNRFYTTNDPTKSEHDQVRGSTGEIWYRILGYADTEREAREIIFGIRNECSQVPG